MTTTVFNMPIGKIHTIQATPASPVADIRINEKTGELEMKSPERETWYPCKLPMALLRSCEVELKHTELDMMYIPDPYGVDGVSVIDPVHTTAEEFDRVKSRVGVYTSRLLAKQKADSLWGEPTVAPAPTQDIAAQKKENKCFSCGTPESKTGALEKVLFLVDSQGNPIYLCDACCEDAFAEFEEKMKYEIGLMNLPF